ncbi:MAG: ABC transporter permease subunit [Acidimicrobiaceae bacterium]|nr:ABC transporter permease subunit [Acidimicrobiaceae bacterium]MCY4280734.1 ABC transporter permease subunit [Acidimicrobiaceae bacterium]MCY4295075.1 ABC transporter permease subunit [Acidimicrobiaceae bacterium]
MSNTDQETLAVTQSRRPPFYRDATVLKWLAQVAALALVLFALIFMAGQAGSNLQAKDIATGYDFLGVSLGSDLGSGIDTNPDTSGRALWVGMVNTIRVSIGGILLASVLGVVVGVGRLSSNWLVKRSCSVYVETLRNIPLLVQIILIFAVIASLPRVAIDQGPIHGWLHISNKGVSIPRVHIGDGFYQWLIFLLIGAAVGLWVKRRRSQRHDVIGRDTYPVASFVAVVAAFALAGWFAHPIFGWVGGIFDFIASVLDALTQQLVQLLISAAAAAAAVLWIRRFLARHRTPAGRTKLSDDDYFRVIFAGLAAVLAVLFVTVGWPGFSSWIINSGRDLFEVLGDKFGDGRTGQPIDAKRPDIEQLGNFPNYGPAGLNLTQGLAAVYFGVVLYTAAFIAEIVRAGIQAVPKGQTEAAQALGLRRLTMLRRVILPQALRVILPPLGNQYLNLTKNTSLALAIGYTDLVQVGQTVYNQTGKTLEVVSIWMLFYLACSLTISVVVNFFNVRLKIVER